MESDQESIFLNNVYDYIGGYSAVLNTEMAENLKNDPEVIAIEEDKKVYSYDSQLNSPWGLARISSREKIPFDNQSLVYKYNNIAGKGVNVYVLDSGVNVDHVDFEGRATITENFSLSKNNSDEVGHGTHCAGTIGGKVYGIAKKAKLFSVKCLGSDGSGTLSTILQAIEFTIKHSIINGGLKGNVASMSLGSEKSEIVNEAIKRGVESGIVFVVAAGNDYTDACKFSPASSEYAITVGATDMFDQSAIFSNYGKCVDVYAPGNEILSAWTGSNNAYRAVSGTSMAAPHVAGLAAYIMSLSNKKLTPSEVKKEIIKSSLKNVLNIAEPDSPNLMINNLSFK